MAEQVFQTETMTGGLDTRSPAHKMEPGSSPDLQNVTLDNEVVEKRGGFVPLIRAQPKSSAIRNQGFHVSAREDAAAGSSNIDYLIVPGEMLAGHRQSYTDNAGAFSIDFFVSPSDLTTSHGGNGQQTATTTGLVSPFTIAVRPILFKGPTKRTLDYGATLGRTALSKTVGQFWGAGSSDGMPFGIYLYNNAGTWEFRLSFHTKNISNSVWNLRTISAGITVDLNQKYHVIVTIDDGNEARLRVAKIGGTYSNATYVFSDETLTTGNQCPIQVFNCPQAFIDTTTTGTTSIRPGLGLSNGISGNIVTGDGTKGTWFFACKRFEGVIEDIVVWKGDMLDADGTNLDRTSKLDLGGLLPDGTAIASSVINYWDMVSFSDDFVAEKSGKDNHLYLAPGGPLDDVTAGSPRQGKGWWFNGSTSYAHLTDPGPNWRTFDVPGISDGWMLKAVRNNLPHGIRVVIRPDSIEPQGVQVIAEIHTVMRVEINGSGNILVSVRDGDAASASSDAARGYQYQTVAVGSHVLKPGVRYDIAVFRYDSGGGAGKTVAVYINGQQDVLDSTLTPSNNFGSSVGQGGATVSTMTLGMGSSGMNIATSDPNGDPDSRTGGVNDINLKHSSGYVGRIESVTVLGGGPTVVLPEQTVYKDEDTDDWFFDQQRLWRSPEFFTAARNELSPNDINDLVTNVGLGGGVQIQPDRQSNGSVFLDLRYNVSTDSGSKYVISMAHARLSRTGHDNLTQASAKVWHAIGHWYLAAPEGENYHTGRYLSSLEFFNTPAGTAAPQDRFDYGVWVEDTGLFDETGALGPLTRRCQESDRASEQGPLGSAPPEFQHRQRPYPFRSPYELRPRWDVGMAIPLAETQDMTLLADWHHQASGERFLFTAASRQLYWAKPIWRRSSPFASECGADPADSEVCTTHALWSFGRIGEHIRATRTQAGQVYTDGNPLEMEVWLYPTRLDGSRLIAFLGDPRAGVTGNEIEEIEHVNFGLFTVDGALHIFGTMSFGAATWHYAEASLVGGSTVIPEPRLRVDSWNHVHLRLRTNGTVELRVNGEFATLHDHSTVGGAADALVPANVDPSPLNLYLLGLPEQERSQTFTVAAAGADITYTFESWHGMMTEFRLNNVEDTVRWPLGESGVPPKERFTVLPGDTTPPYLFHFNEGAGWGVGAVGDIEGANIELAELVPVKTDLAESQGYRYAHAVFRDELLITNGRDFPHRVRFTRFSDPQGPFRCWRLGMARGHSEGAAVTALTATESGATTSLTNGTYNVYVAFVNDLGDESDPYLMGTLVQSAGAFSALKVTNIPRSPDPQVTGRKFYASAAGGGDALEHDTIPDNESGEAELYESASGVAVPLAGTRLAAPRAKHIAVGGGTTFLANLPDVDSGENTFAFARLANGLAEFLADGFIAIDSENGNPITGMVNYLGRLYLFKRDSSWQFGLFGTGDPTNGQAYLRNINPSEGAGGGVTVYGNAIFGSGDRGVYGFDGSSTGYMSPALQGDWGSVDTRDRGLIVQHGTYYWPSSQYWLSVRLRGETRNTRVYVFDTLTGDRRAWTRMELLPHTYMATVVDSVTELPRLVIGTTSGQILRYDPDTVIDGHDGGRQDTGDVTLQGTTGALGLRDIQSLTGLDLIGPGLRGIPVTITYVAQGTTYTETRTIQSNTATTISWLEALSNTPDSLTSWVLGAIDAWWSSPWLAPQQYGQWMHVYKLDIDFQPDATTLTVDARLAMNERILRTFDTSTTGLITKTESLTNGFQDQPIDLVGDRGHARYVRVRFSTNQIQDKFRISGWGFRFDTLLAKGGVLS